MRTQIVAVAALLVVALGCSKEEAKQVQDKAGQAVSNAAKKAGDAVDIAVPIRGKDDPAARERERFNEDWRQLESVRAEEARRRQTQAQQQQQANIRFVPNGKESFEGLDANAIVNAPVVVPLKGDVSGPSVLKTQVYLDRLNYSVGVLDGRWGRNSSIALWWFQRSRGIDAKDPGALDEETFRALASSVNSVPVLVQHTLTADDLKGPFKDIPDDVYEQEKLDCLCYESVHEKLAERFHATQEFLARINPNVSFAELKAGDRIWVPNVRPPTNQDRQDIARVRISIRGNTFSGFDQQDNLIFHAPTTLGSEYDPSPRETVEVKKITFDPWFHYQPTLFHEVSDDEPEANLSPGPNSPVGIVWIALSKPHFGIHGTSSPDSIGYASSHGCVRLTNWDARDVAHRLKPGVKVEFVDTRAKQTASAQ